MEFIKENKIWLTLITVCVAVIGISLALILSDNRDKNDDLLLNIPVVLDHSVDELVDAFSTTEETHPVDENPPLILGGSSITVEVGASGVPGPMLCIDDYDRSVECKAVGEYDLNKIGKYSLRWVSTDSSGNTASKEFTLNVVEKKSTKASTEEVKVPALPIADAVEKYKNDNTAVGIDVSKWQGDIDWEKVADSGVEFVIIRLGVQNGFGGENTLDSFFLQNYMGAKSVGLDVGVYFYSYAVNLKEAAQQAKFVLQTIADNKLVLDLPVVYDWESWTKLSTLGMSLNDLNDCAEIFLELMNEAGLRSSIYSSKYYLKNGIWNTDYSVWLAHYTSETDYDGAYEMWQCSQTGRVPGINGDVDIDVLYKDGNKVRTSSNTAEILTLPNIVS